MAMLSVFEITGSALVAQSKRLNVSASNLANAESVAGPHGQPYRAKQVIFDVDPFRGGEIGGVKIHDVIESPEPSKRVYDPGHPAADSQGYVHMPNVDAVSEMVNVLSASNSYQANVEVASTARKLVSKTLELGQ